VRFSTDRHVPNHGHSRATIFHLSFLELPIELPYCTNYKLLSHVCIVQLFEAQGAARDSKKGRISHCVCRLSVCRGGVFTGISVVQGASFTPRLLALNCGGLYLYNALQCPLEAVHGRRSWVHNVLVAGGLGAAAFQKGLAGIPFVEHGSQLPPRLSPVLCRRVPNHLELWTKLQSAMFLCRWLLRSQSMAPSEEVTCCTDHRFVF
jgi:hypothetical protein